MELYIWENRYRQFKDKKWNRTCGRRGTNQKVEPYMWENVPPAKDPLMLIIKKELNKRATERDASDPHDFIKTI